MMTDTLASARALRSGILEGRSSTEDDRRLAEPIVEALRTSGLCRLALPTEVGGLEAHPVDALGVYEELAAAEASVAWVVWNQSAPAFFGRTLGEAALGEVFGGRQHMYAGSTRPTGKAVVANGGFRVSGRWSLVSGCLHAEWLAFMCLIEEGGELRMMGPDAPELRMIFVPKDRCQVVDTWRVGGLRGTGSHDIVLDEVDVSAERTCSPFEPTRIERPIGRIPIACTMSAGHAAICIGIAQGALDTLLELGRTKVSVDPVPSLRDRPGNQRTVATEAAAIAASREHLHGALSRLWDAAASADGCSPDVVADVWTAAVTGAQRARSAVGALYEIAGTPALYTDCTLERAHRDIHAAMQHIVAQPLWLEQAGAVKLGLEPTHPLFMI